MPPSDLRIAVVAAVPMSINVFMVPHLRQLATRHHVSVLASCAAADLALPPSDRVSFIPVPIARAVAVWRDVRALLVLWRVFRAQRFDVVQSITPKAGLLSMLAARMAGVPVRIHWFTGQVWATRRGPVRWLLKSLDRVLAGCATDLLADSPSQRDFLVREEVAQPGRIVVLGAGSVCGVDTARFTPDPVVRARVRRAHDIPDSAVVFLYLGRLTREKGVVELAQAFVACAADHPDVMALVVGPDEAGAKATMLSALGPWAARARFIDYTSVPEHFMAAADVFVMPSYREGFGSSVIEAAACGLPAIGSAIYGLSDAIEDGHTGVLVPARDVSALSAALTRMATDRGWREQLGTQARRRALATFSQEVLTSALPAFYEACIARRRSS